jgi:hypothetical protein
MLPELRRYRGLRDAFKYFKNEQFRKPAQPRT